MQTARAPITAERHPYVLLSYPSGRLPEVNLCRSCGEDFNSLTLFDRHRVGKHAYTFHEGLRMNPPVENGRRCLDIEEMRGKGWEKNKLSRWIDPAKVYKTRSENPSTEFGHV